MLTLFNRQTTHTSLDNEVELQFLCLCLLRKLKYWVKNNLDKTIATYMLVHVSNFVTFDSLKKDGFYLNK